jgi:hypothetical protein
VRIDYCHAQLVNYSIPSRGILNGNPGVRCARPRKIISISQPLGASERVGVLIMVFIQVDGQWQIQQENGFIVDVNIEQTNNLLNGFASHSGGTVRSTSVTGSVENEHFDVTINWDNGTNGHYTGDLQPVPLSTDRQQPLIGTSTWQSLRMFNRL